MKNPSYSPTFRYLGCLLLLLTALSCSKTNYEQLKRPYNDITHFAIGGYNQLDSIRAVIVDNEIRLYWSAEAERPAKVTPSIVVSPGATISPASDEEVSFAESTVYTVTAEDGTAREYKLVPLINEAIPLLSALDNFGVWQWGTIHPLKINGEYFLNSGGAGNVRAYAQRLRDGYEFDLEVVEDQTIQTQLAVELPKFTTEQDTGMHRIYVKVGDFPSNSLDVYVGLPVLSNVITSFTLEEAGQPIYLGDMLTITLNLGHKIDMDQFKRYFNSNNFEGLQFNMSDINSQGSSAVTSLRGLSDITLEDNKITARIDDTSATLSDGTLYPSEIYVHFTYDYSYYGGSPDNWTYERYKTLRDSGTLPLEPGSLFSGPTIGPYYNDMRKNFANEATKRATVLMKRD